MPLARALVIVLGLVHMVGLADLVMDDACEELCSGDGCERDCLPGVACRCHCPSAMPSLSLASSGAVAKVDTHVLEPFAVEQRLHANPDPREILHVPRRSG